MKKKESSKDKKEEVSDSDNYTAHAIQLLMRGLDSLGATIFHLKQEIGGIGIDIGRIKEHIGFKEPNNRWCKYCQKVTGTGEHGECLKCRNKTYI